MIKDDHSASFASISNNIVGGNGRSAQDFARTLKPKYHVAWSHIAGGYMAISAGVAVAAWVELLAPELRVPAVIVMALWLGWFFAFLNNFLHEAVHHNLAPGKRLNDILANLFVGFLVAQDVRTSRPIHWNHHRLLGTIEDPERSYFNALTPEFIFKLASGLHSIKVLLGRQKDTIETLAKSSGEGSENRSFFTWVSFCGALFHASAVVTAVAAGFYAVAASWVLGFLFVFPMFAALRQLLEHRDERARSDLDYRRVPHGAMARNFGDGILASTFGSAGFNHHLIHHWYPEVSYTRLKELESFLKTTGLNEILTQRESTYGRTIRALFSRRR